MGEYFDIAIIGSGPGGYVSAIRAAQLGFKTVCIDKRETLGGTCLNVGCIPSKSLLKSSEFFFHLKKSGKEHGIECEKLSIDFAQMTTRKNQVVKSLVDGVAGLFSRHKITTLHGNAEFIGPHALRITKKDGSKEEIEASYILIATGSEAIALPHLSIDERQVVTSTGALSLKQIPERLIVIGAGVIGVELASVYNRLGSQVTVIEMLDHICSVLDKQISKSLQQSLQKQGINFLLSSSVVSTVIQPDEIILTVEQNAKLQTLTASVVLVAIGRRPNTDGLQVEKIGIQRDKKGFIIINEHFQTALPHIFAIGDVIEGPMLAHRASAEGIAVVESLKEEQSLVNYLSIPNVVYTSPEVAYVGLTEEEAKETGLELLVGSSFFRGNPRARCNGETEGYVKVIGEKKTGRLLGMHIIGQDASELIAEGMIAMQNKLTLKDLADVAQAHPTLGEAIKEAALDSLGRPIHH